MKWIECNKCKAQAPVADSDAHTEWLEPCDICGGYGWHEMKPETRSPVFCDHCGTVTGIVNHASSHETGWIECAICKEECHELNEDGGEV